MEACDKSVVVLKHSPLTTLVDMKLITTHENSLRQSILNIFEYLDIENDITNSLEQPSLLFKITLASI